MPSAESDSQETEALLEQAAAGDSLARERLLQRHRPRLREFVEAHLDPALRARLDASDVVQEAQMEAARRLPDFLSRRPMPFRVWLRKTAYERLLMRHYEDLPYEDIGCILGIEPAAARKRAGRALVRLHALLAERERGGEGT